MSSWRKAAKINQVTHRERHQPESRKSLGLLEKHSDYKKRANDFQQKRDTIALLRKRALNKNPDEFYHHMINSKIEDGMHREKKTDEDTPDQIKLMKAQDLKYINYKQNLEAKKIQKLQAQLHMIDVNLPVQNKHTFFVDSKEELRKFDLARRLKTPRDIANQKNNKPSDSSLQNATLTVISDKATEMKAQGYKELRKRIQREQELMVVQQKLELKKNLRKRKGSKPVKLQDGTFATRASYVWNYERQK